MKVTIKEPKFKMTRNQKLYLVCLILGIATIAIGAGMIGEILNPPVYKPIMWSAILKGLAVCLGFSFIFHGFHPMLLVKSRG